MDVFKKYYTDVSNGIHRYATEAFYEKEASEKLFHIGSPTTALDFGCGSADLTVYFARTIPNIVGADFSENMLGHARKRAERFGVSNIDFVCADEIGIWNHLGDRTFDAIVSSGVIQYLSPVRFEQFTRASLKHLAPGGIIAHFDIPDPRIYALVRLGLFGPEPWRLRDVPIALVRFGKFVARKAVDAVRGHPSDIMGYQHHPTILRRIGERCGLEVEVVRSVYYEYRYHILMRIPSSAGSAHAQ